jgi:hypothetical protein
MFLADAEMEFIGHILRFICLWVCSMRVCLVLKGSKDMMVVSIINRIHPSDHCTYTNEVLYSERSWTFQTTEVDAELAPVNVEPYNFVCWQIFRE